MKIHQCKFSNPPATPSSISCHLVFVLSQANFVSELPPLRLYFYPTWIEEDFIAWIESSSCVTLVPHKEKSIPVSDCMTIGIL